MKPFIKQVINPASNAHLFSKKYHQKRVPKSAADRAGTRSAYRMSMKRDMHRQIEESGVNFHASNTHS